MSIIILHPGAYLQIGDAGQDLVEHTCASASALHIPSRLGRGEEWWLWLWSCGCKPKATYRLPQTWQTDAPRPSTCLSQIISRAHVQMQKRACVPLSQMSRALIGRARQRQQRTGHETRLFGERRVVPALSAVVCRVESLLAARYSLHLISRQT
jgi:hypothetical protein